MSSIRRISRRRPSSTSTLLLVVCLAQFMVILDVSIVNVALPSIHNGLDFSTDRPAVGGQRLHADVRRVPDAGRPLRRPARPPPRVPRRDGSVRVLLARVRAGGHAGSAARSARAAGLWRRGALARDPVDHHELLRAPAPRATGRWECGAQWARSAHPPARCWAVCSRRASGGLRSSRSTFRWDWRVIALGLRVIPASRPAEGTRHFDVIGAVLITASLISCHLRHRAHRHRSAGAPRACSSRWRRSRAARRLPVRGGPHREGPAGGVVGPARGTSARGQRHRDPALRRVLPGVVLPDALPAAGAPLRPDPGGPVVPADDPFDLRGLLDGATSGRAIRVTTRDHGRNAVCVCRDGAADRREPARLLPDVGAPGSSC